MEKQMDSNTARIKDLREQSKVGSTNITWLEDLIEQLKVGSTITCFEDLREQLKTESEENLKKKFEIKFTTQPEIIRIEQTYNTEKLLTKTKKIQEALNTFEIITTTTTNESLKQDSNTIENAGNDISEIGTNTSEQVSMNNW